MIFLKRLRLSLEGYSRYFTNAQFFWRIAMDGSQSVA